MNTTKSNIRLIAIAVYTLIMGVTILILNSMEPTLINLVITLILSLSIIVIYIVSRGILPKFMVIIVAGVNILTVLATIAQITFIFM